MVYRFKYDANDSSLINKQQSDTSKNGSDTVTANDLQVKDLDNMMWMMKGSQKEEAEAKNTTTTITERGGGYLEMAKNVAVVGGAAIVFAAGLGLYCLLSSSSPVSEKVEKMMKAPGKIGEYIVRQPFEDNPRDYFAQLRNSKR